MDFSCELEAGCFRVVLVVEQIIIAPAHGMHLPKADYTARWHVATEDGRKMNAIAKAEVPGQSKVTPAQTVALIALSIITVWTFLHGSVVACAWRSVSPCRCRRGGYRRLPLADALAGIAGDEV